MLLCVVTKSVLCSSVLSPRGILAATLVLFLEEIRFADDGEGTGSKEHLKEEEDGDEAAGLATTSLLLPTLRVPRLLAPRLLGPFGDSGGFEPAGAVLFQNDRDLGKARVVEHFGGDGDGKAARPETASLGRGQSGAHAEAGGEAVERGGGGVARDVGSGGLVGFDVAQQPRAVLFEGGEDLGDERLGVRRVVEDVEGRDDVENAAGVAERLELGVVHEDVREAGRSDVALAERESFVRDLVPVERAVRKGPSESDQKVAAARPQFRHARRSSLCVVAFDD
mmetsp:Transcript_5271/g.16576  ORF Transcript_5271/g.16576 Transcript_5271/m.16576 type:complete len:281 (+) Transcript_5271:2186-3028(+)